MGENYYNIYKNDGHGICGNTNERIALALESIATNLGYLVQLYMQNRP